MKIVNKMKILQEKILLPNNKLKKCQTLILKNIFNNIELKISLQLDNNHLNIFIMLKLKDLVAEERYKLYL